MVLRATVKAEEPSDLGDDREGRASGSAGGRQGRCEAVVSTDWAVKTVRHWHFWDCVVDSAITFYPIKTSCLHFRDLLLHFSLSICATHPLKCSWANLKSCWPSSILSSPYWEQTATALRSRWEAALFQSPRKSRYCKIRIALSSGRDRSSRSLDSPGEPDSSAPAFLTLASLSENWTWHY